MKLLDRVERLEIKLGAKEADDLQAIRLVIFYPVSADPDEQSAYELRRITYGSSEWLKDDGEQEEAFIERALQAAQHQHPGRHVVCMGIAEV